MFFYSPASFRKYPRHILIFSSIKVRVFVYFPFLHTPQSQPAVKQRHCQEQLCWPAQHLHM